MATWLRRPRRDSRLSMDAFWLEMMVEMPDDQATYLSNGGVTCRDWRLNCHLRISNDSVIVPSAFSFDSKRGLP